MVVKMVTVVYSRRIDSDTPDMAVSHPNSAVVVGYHSAKCLHCRAESDKDMPESAEVGRMVWMYNKLAPNI
jgi:hypothetical protein